MIVVFVALGLYLDNLPPRQTVNGFTENDLRVSGTLNPDSSIGLYAADADSYVTFGSLFAPVIERHHGTNRLRVWPASATRATAFGDGSVLPTLRDPRKLVRSVRARVARNVAYCGERRNTMPAGSTASDRQAVEKVLLQALSSAAVSVCGGVGHYHPMHDMSTEVRATSQEARAMFDNGDRYMAAAGILRDWPLARGVFVFPKSTAAACFAWINEEDHLRLFAIRPGAAGVQPCVAALSDMLDALAAQLRFLYDPALGYLTSCPTNLGTGLRFSMLVHLPKLGAADRVRSMCKAMQLAVRGANGEHTSAVDYLFDISNRARMATEESLVRTVAEGVQKLIDAEVLCARAYPRLFSLSPPLP